MKRTPRIELPTDSEVARTASDALERCRLRGLLPLTYHRLSAIIATTACRNAALKAQGQPHTGVEVQP